MGMSLPPLPSGGRVSSIWRLATPESEKERTCAIVPSCSGAYSGSTLKVISALPLSASSILLTLPAGVPPTVTTSPPTSWEAFVKSAVTS